MKWATRSNIHFDRLAAAWMISRFIDPDAEFLFLDEGVETPAGVRTFGLPGDGQALHEGGSTAFRELIDKHEITCPALLAIAVIVEEAVDHVMRDTNREGLLNRHPDISGLLTAAEGMMIFSSDDFDYLGRGSALLDAFHARIEVRLAIDASHASSPTTILERTRIFTEQLLEMRSSGGDASGSSLAKRITSGAEAA